MLVAALVPGAAGAGSVGDTPRLDAVPPPAEAASFRPDPNLVALGKRVFFDPRLSEPRAPRARRATIRRAPSPRR